jgi:hypothetical protein
MQQHPPEQSRQAEIGAFFEAHRRGIATLVEQAYQQAGGHYAQMSASRRREQALIDTGEIVAQLGSAEVNQQAIDSSIQSLPSLEILTDVVHMSEAFQRLIVAYIQLQLAGDAELCRKVLARVNNTSQRFRMNLTSAYAMRVRVQIDESSPS